jgi:serine/threonine protein kinase
MNRVNVHSSLESFVVDLSMFEGVREIGFVKSSSGSEVSVKQYSRQSDGFEIVVKSFDSFGCENVDEILYELFILAQLKHRCIAPLIGFVLPTDSTPLKTATLYYCCDSLEEVQMNNPVWWTSTTKAKAIAGIALGMKSAHRMDIVHGSLNPNNIMFDENHCVHIVDFRSSYFRSKGKYVNEMDEDHNDSKVDAAKMADVFSFASIMFDILIDRSPVSHSLVFDEEAKQRMKKGEFPTIPEFIPKFVRGLIADGWSGARSTRYSFDSMIEVMKQNRFVFAEEVDIDEVFEFVNTVEKS